MLLGTDVSTVAIPGGVAIAVAAIGYLGIRLQVRSKLVESEGKAEKSTSEAIDLAEKRAAAEHDAILDRMADAVAISAKAQADVAIAAEKASRLETALNQCMTKYDELRELVTNELAGRERRRQEAGIEGDPGRG